MKIGEMKESKFLKKEDVGKGVLVTIDRIEQQDVSLENQPEEMKWIMYFKEVINNHNKGLVLNWTNIQLCAQAVSSEDTDHWPGKQIVLYLDPTISFGGKIIGGIRIRAPKTQPQTPEPAPVVNTAESFDDFDDDIPF
jgi:hypothetical protein